MTQHLQNRSVQNLNLPELSGSEAALVLLVLDHIRSELWRLYGCEIHEALLDFEDPCHLSRGESKQ